MSEHKYYCGTRHEEAFKVDEEMTNRSPAEAALTPFIATPRVDVRLPSFLVLLRAAARVDGKIPGNGCRSLSSSITGAPAWRRNVHVELSVRGSRSAFGPAFVRWLKLGRRLLNRGGRANSAACWRQSETPCGLERLCRCDQGPRSGPR